MELVFSTGFPQNLAKKYKFGLQIVDFKYVLNGNSTVLSQILKVSTFWNSGQVIISVFLPQGGAKWGSKRGRKHKTAQKLVDFGCWNGLSLTPPAAPYLYNTQRLAFHSHSESYFSAFRDSPAWFLKNPFDSRCQKLRKPPKKPLQLTQNTEIWSPKPLLLMEVKHWINTFKIVSKLILIWKYFWKSMEDSPGTFEGQKMAKNDRLPLLNRDGILSGYPIQRKIPIPGILTQMFMVSVPGIF